MTTTKPPTPQGISALLRKAGFTRSIPSGQYWRHPGFIVRKDWADDHAVRVDYFNASGGVTQAHTDARLREYTKAITDAGWHVESGVYGALIVTAGEG